MGFLDNTTITVDAILTKKGRELLARGDGSFNPTQFALADDEINYKLYNPDHPSGSAYYGEAIEAMPVLEAFADDSQVMKYKLVTLPRGTARMPIVSIGQETIILKQGESKSITPETLNYLTGGVSNEPSGYVATVADSRALAVFAGEGIDSEEAQNLNAITTTGTNISKSVIGKDISLRATTVNTLFGDRTSIQTTITFIGRDSGARVSIPLTINKL